MTQPNPWNLSCFGGLKAERCAVRLSKFRTQKTAALLALLSLRGAQNREAICALLWPDNAPEAARNSLSAALSALRRDLGDEAVCADRQSVALAPGAVETDVAAFDFALKNGDVARAVELYRGHLLPGFHEDPFPLLAGEYEEKARGAFRSRLEELEANGQCEELLGVARRAFPLFGDDERWFLGLMRAHFGLGDFDAALRAYEALGRFARKNGDVSSDEARQLAKTIRREKEAAGTVIAPASHRNLGAESLEENASIARFHLPQTSAPAPEILLPPLALPQVWTRFFGREAERAMLCDWLRNGEKLVTLSGAGGSGKTRLALETLRELSEDWNGDIAFVPLAALSDPELIVPAIRDALALTATADCAPLELLERALRGRRVLLFLDNFEQLVEGGAARLQTLRERLPGVSFLVTSRVLLQLPGEREFPVAPLPTPLQNSGAAQVKECASAALFCDRAGLLLDAENAQAIGALCRRLDGIPLALELAAARAKVLSPAQILERLQKHPDFLSSRELGIPARHKTLRATIEWSIALLSPELRAFWTRLSLFHGGWTLEAAERVAAPGICEDFETLDFLTQLRECSLVFVEERDGSSRFRMLQTLREFGREQLQGSESVERARFEFFLELATQAASAMQGPGQTAWLSRLDAEGDNLRAALAWARDHDAPRGLQLATSLIDFWETRLNLDEGRDWIETFLRATERPDASAPHRARALSGAGRLAWYAADFSQSDSLLERGLEAARQGGDSGEIIYSIHSAARLAAVAGENERAQALGREGVRLARETGQRAPLLAALIDLCPAFVVAGDFAAVRATCDEAIALARVEGDGHALAVGLYLHGIADYYSGDFAVARPLLEESERICRGLGSRWDLMVCLGTLGSVLREEGELAAAARALHETLSICREEALGDHNVVSMTLTTSYLLCKRGQTRQAARLMGACQAWHHALGIALMPFMADYDGRYRDRARSILGEAAFEQAWQEGRALTPSQTLDTAIEALSEHAMSDDAAPLAARAKALSGAARLAWYASDNAGALPLLEQSLQAARLSGDQSALIYATRTFARVRATGGQAERASELGRESVRLARQAGDDSLLLSSLLDLGFADFNLGDIGAAERNAAEALALARGQGDDAALALALTMVACVYEKQNRLDEALEFIGEAEAVCRRLGVQWELMVCLSLQGQIWSKRGDFARAQRFYNEGLSLCRDTLLSTWHVVTTLLSLSWAWMRRGDARGAVTVMGATSALSEAIGYTLMPALVPERDHFENLARQQLGETEFQNAWKRGHRMTPEAAVNFAMNPGVVVDEIAPKNAPEMGGETDAARIAARSRALSGAGRLAWYDADFGASRALVRQGLEAARTSGDAASFVHAVAAFVRLSSISGDAQGEIAQGRQLSEEAVHMARKDGDEALLVEALISLAYAATMVDDLAGMREILREAIALARKIGDDRQLATALISLATLAYRERRFEAARSLLDESTLLSRRLDAPFLIYASLWVTSNVAREVGDFDLARDSIGEALELCRDNAAFRWNASNGLLTASYLLIARGETSRGAELMSAAQELGAQVGYQLVPLLRLDFERFRALARETLGESAFDAAWRRGRALTFTGALDFAVAPPHSALDATLDETLAARSRALSGAGRLAWHDGDIKASRDRVLQGLDAARKSGDAGSFVYAVAAFVRFAMSTGDVEGFIAQSRRLGEEAVERARHVDDRALLLEALTSLAYAETISGLLDESRRTTDEAIALARELGDESHLVRVLNNRASVEYHDNRLVAARAIITESEAIARRLGSPWDLLVSLWTLSSVAREQGQLDLAHQAICETLEISRATSFRWGVSNLLQTASYGLVRRGQAGLAVRLMGASTALNDAFGYHFVPVLRPDFERHQAQARAVLGEAAFEAAWQEGRALSPETAIDLAIQAQP